MILLILYTYAYVACTNLHNRPGLKVQSCPSLVLSCPKKGSGRLHTYSVTRCRIDSHTTRRRPPDTVRTVHTPGTTPASQKSCFSTARRLSRDLYPYRRPLRGTYACAGRWRHIVCLPVGIRIPLNSGDNHPPRQFIDLETDWMVGPVDLKTARVCAQWCMV